MTLGRVLSATIQDKGNCPCPYCLIPKTDFPHLSLLADFTMRTAKIWQYFQDQVRCVHNLIYKSGSPIKGTILEHYLKNLSLVPTFVSDHWLIWPITSLRGSPRIHFLMFLVLWVVIHIFKILTIDLIHAKLGVFKSVLRQLICLLYATSQDAIQVVNTQ